MNIEVLEGNLQEMALMDPLQQVPVRFPGAFEVEPAQVALNIHRDSRSAGIIPTPGAACPALSGASDDGARRP